MSTPTSLGAKAPAARRQRIMDAAVQVLKDKGFAGTRVADIASAAGTSPALVVYHFGTLDGVLAAALASVEDAFYDDLAESVPQDTGAVQRLRLLGELGSDTEGTRDWSLWMEIWVRALRDDQIQELRRALDGRWRETVRATIDLGVTEGAFTCSDPASAATRLAALMDGLGVQVALGDPSVPAERMASLWLECAAAELGLDPALLLGP
ncbi:MAG: TetR family transcriptional regulator C-terminal domain-containing protein [Candidatus Nanopelagicales bacterium]